MQDLDALEGKSLPELREIGKTLGVKDLMVKKQQLIANIAAAAGVQIPTPEAAASETVPADEKPRRGRRPRMNTVRIENNSPVKDAVAAEPDGPAAAEMPVAESNDTAEKEPVVAGKANRAEDAPAAEVQAPKRRGRKPKARPEVQDDAAPAKQFKPTPDCESSRAVFILCFIRK